MRSLVENLSARSAVIPFSNEGAIAHFFCADKHGSISEDTVLRSLLHQLLQANRSLYETINYKLEKHQTWRSWKSEQNFNTAALWDALEGVLGLTKMRNTAIILDAVDEMPMNGGVKILDGLLKIVGNLNLDAPQQRVKILVSSRDIPNSERLAKGMFSLRMQDQEVKADIRKYIRNSILDFAKENKTFAQAVEKTTTEKIASCIIDKAEGMFLWADIAWNSFKGGLLWNADTIEARLRSLDMLPPGLDSLYEALILQVDSLKQKDMWHIFGTLATAKRPLTGNELASLLAMMDCEREFEKSTDIHAFPDIESIITDNFANMVKIGDDGFINFVHLSFKEFILKRSTADVPFSFPRTNRNITKACLLYLNLGDIAYFVKKLEKTLYLKSYEVRFNIESKFGLFNYAANFFLEHLREVSHEDDSWLILADMATEMSILSHYWNSNYLGLSKIGSPLKFIIDLNSELLVQRFAQHGYDLDDKWLPQSFRKRFEYSTALHYCLCSAGPLTNFAHLLLNLGANPNTLDFNGRSPLHLALKEKSWLLIEKLLSFENIQVNVLDPYGCAPLHIVAGMADSEVISTFLALPHIDVNIQSRQGSTPLHFAAMARNLQTVRRLLEHNRVRLDIVDKQGRTALTVAMYWNYEDVARLFIENNKAIPTPNRQHLSSIICAAKHVQKGLTLELIAKCCNLNEDRDLDGKGIIHLAAINDWPDILEIAIAPGQANLNQVDHSGGTGLHYAATLGNIQSLETLLKFGASARFQDRNGRTAAHAAADAGFKDALMLLLRAPDCDVNQRDHQGRSLVHWAASCDWLDVVQAVIEKPGADLARRDKYGKTALDIARLCRCPTVWKYLRCQATFQSMCSDDHSYYSDTITKDTAEASRLLHIAHKADRDIEETALEDLRSEELLSGSQTVSHNSSKEGQVVPKDTANSAYLYPPDLLALVPKGYFDKVKSSNSGKRRAKPGVDAPNRKRQRTPSSIL
jgi:ankyrin repeat protein